MSSQWPSALISLDESLKDLDSSLLQLEAARPIEFEQVLARLKQAAESSHELRALLLSEMPQAHWQDRDQLDALLVIRASLRRRAALLALANELEYGTISHRRAARVAQLNQLREQAIDELRGLGGAEDPLSLPGPDATRWINWASSLKEPEDTASLQALRAGFPGLDEFVAALEPGMWVVPAAPGPEEQAQAAANAALAAQEVEERRARLLALASELERGDVVHHRAIRVTQANQLRDQAIQELRFQAVVARAPAILPGPEADQWVHWACTLKEPDDAEALQHLREGFVHLDEFVANLEPGMWVSGGPAPAEVAPVEQHTEPVEQQAPRSQAAERETPYVAPVSAPAATPRKEPAVTTLIASDDDGTHGFAARLKSALATLSGGKQRIVLPIVVLVLAVTGAMMWRLHRTSASSPTKAAETAAPENASTASNTPSNNNPAAAVAPVTRAPEVTEKAKPKDANDSSKIAAAAAQPKPEPPPVLTGASLRTPQAMPKSALVARADEPNNPADGAGMAPGTLPGGVSNGFSNFVKEVPGGTPRMPAQKIKVSSGVAQGQLIHQVTPVYPATAKLAGVRGVVVLQAVVGKDGSVQNVRALRGPPMLVQSAVDAVKQWRYKPFAINGEPAEADIEVNVNFNP